MHEAHSFPPIVAEVPKVLILGSIPGIKSLAAQQYYAHSQNVFWRIMSGMFDMPADSYIACKKIITGNHLALWDVMQQCTRAGSLDSAIEDDTIQVNDFATFLAAHMGIRYIFFNGGKAASVFKKLTLPTLSPEIAARLSLHTLPSTSPAHASITFEDKLNAWADIKKRILD